MTSPDLPELVTRAQSGDPEAFSALVERFGRMATAYAYGVLRDLDAAEDAAQEAFIEAYEKLGQLRAPAAFATWLRRIVFKRCDRRLRRREPAPPPPLAPDDPEDIVARARARAWVRDAVEGLPEHQRVVVALHYFGEAAQAEVAEFLELPLSTVKKRLHSARRRLEATRQGDMQTTISKPTALADRVRLFLGIRARDSAAVLGVLDRHPSWIDRPEQWADEEALEGGFPLAHRATPLGLAASVGDLRLVDALLERGASVDGRCGCAAGDTPLFAAVAHGRLEVARRLLEAGADPSATNAAGHTALDVARMRGQVELTRLLEGAGGVAGAGPPVAPRAAVEREARLETGIRVVDLLAPLAPGMLVRVHAAAETGLMVLMAELSLRLLTLGWRVRWTTWAVKPWQTHELADFVAQMGLQDRVDVSSAGLTPDRARGADRLAHFVFRVEGREADVEAALPSLSAGGGLGFVIAPWIPVTRGDSAAPRLAAPYDAQLVTDPGLAGEGIYPALDFALTASRLEVDPAHAELQVRVRARADDPRVRALAGQPFFVVQHDNGRPGVHGPLDQSQRGFEAALVSWFTSPSQHES